MSDRILLGAAGGVCEDMMTGALLDVWEEIKDTLQSGGVKVKVFIVRLRSHEEKLKSRTPRTGTGVWERHNDESKDVWSKALWTDEVKINLYLSDERGNMW